MCCESITHAAKPHLLCVGSAQYTLYQFTVSAARFVTGTIMSQINIFREACALLTRGATTGSAVYVIPHIRAT